MPTFLFCLLSLRRGWWSSGGGRGGYPGGRGGDPGGRGGDPGGPQPTLISLVWGWRLGDIGFGGGRIDIILQFWVEGT